MKYDEFDMKVIEAVLERATDGTYTVYCKNESFSGAGETIEAAKQDMLAQMSFYKNSAREAGFRYPAFLDEEYRISYTIVMPSLIKYYFEKGIFTLSGMEKVTGINQKQLWSYLNGTKPRKTQSERIESGFRALSQDLDSIFITQG